MQFILTINMGNEGAEDVEDIAQMLRNTANKLDRWESEGHIIDINGNTVGAFVMVDT